MCCVLFYIDLIVSRWNVGELTWAVLGWRPRPGTKNTEACSPGGGGGGGGWAARCWVSCPTRPRVETRRPRVATCRWQGSSWGSESRGCRGAACSLHWDSAGCHSTIRYLKINNYTLSNLNILLLSDRGHLIRREHPCLIPAMTAAEWCTKDSVIHQGFCILTHPEY